jgi:adenine specific DNA methylase
VKPIDGAHSQFVRHPSTDVLERELRIQAREKLRKDRKRHELTKKRKQVKETATSS